MAKQIDYNDFWYIKDNPITKAGVFPYLGKQIDPSLEPDKIYMVLRPADEIEKAKDTFKLLPLVDEHTMLGPDFTPAEQKGIHGVLGSDIKAKDGTLYSDVKIYSEYLKDEIKNGKKELSCGYFCKYDLTPGVYNGVHYDAVQRDLRGNHIALVDNGRMGHDVRVMDSFNFACDSMALGDFVRSRKSEFKTNWSFDFDESKIKRDESGKFANKEGGDGKGKTSSKVLESKKAIKEKAIEMTKGMVPVAKIKGNEFIGPDIKSRRESAKQFYENELRGKPFTNKSSGKIIEIADGGKTFSETGYDDKINSFVYLPKILTDSVYLGKAEDEKGRSNVKGFHYFACNIETPEGKGLVIVSAKEDNNGKLYYNHHITKEEMDSVKAGIQPGTGTTSSADSIGNNSENVKAYFWGEQGEDMKIFDLEENNKKSDLSSKNHGNSGQDAATEKENKMDKRDIIREIMAVAAKPADQFEGGEEEREREIAKLAEKIAYNPSETGANDEDPEKDKEDKEKLVKDKVEGCDEEKEEEAEKIDLKKIASDSMKSVLEMLGKRESLYSKLTPHIGAFDHADMTEESMAKYACKKLNIAVDSGDDVCAVLKGYLKGAEIKKKEFVTIASDSALSNEEDAGFDKFMKGE